MNGIICIDKPAGFTSFDVVAKMRGMLKTKKIGHSGTLDPMATGVLPLFIGRAAKAIDLIPNHDKRYTATFILGITTDTQDTTGEIINKRDVHVTPEEIAAAIKSFSGTQKQIPPMYSAVRINGQRLYDLARQGIETERAARDVIFYDITLLEHDAESNTCKVDVSCSKGTYIRTLCNDIGEILGCGAAMSSLRRTEACGFTLDSCLTLSQVQELADKGLIANELAPVDSLFESLPKLHLSEKQARMYASGMRLSLERLGLSEAGEGICFTVYNQTGEFIALARADTASDSLISLKWFGST